MNHNRFAIFTCCAALVGLSACCCVVNKLDTTPRTITLRSTGQGTPVTIVVTKGLQWSNRMQFGPLIFNVLPQMAVWTETPEGKLIETVYITGADYKKIRHAEKDKKGAAFWAECLPVWSSRMQAAGKPLPSKENPYTDAVTSATPMGNFALRSTLAAESRPYMVCVEINKSGDVNAAYTRENNGSAGQPSLIYTAAVPADPAKGPLHLSLAGHGGRIKDAPAIHPDTTGFDSALKQLEDISITFE